ncbi:peptidoglycan D,D-transpeptidase FtsI family protein [Allorhizocola rhizosphaerae]|uniref:peptidoglycan D,D-transpeptidase FtsI family protein n=1 Tax=Allorhizocola rhizosphaerae TaxID=1872709 RepID=UPI000E3CC720|nr:penicillin-binding protein 2 [Allorhizocola rhizosphaerae]
MAEDKKPYRRSGIGNARAYTPRGRTVRDTGPVERVVHKATPVPRKKAASRKLKPPPRQRVVLKKLKIKRTPTPPRMGEPKRRLRLATALSLLLFTIIGVRLVQLQLTDAPAYAAAGLRDRLTTIDLPAPRGSILDRNGAVLAHSVEARYVGVDPEMVKDIPATAAALSPHLGVAVSELVPKMEKKAPGSPGWRFQFLKRGVDVEVAQRIADLKLPGISIDRDERRDVPGLDLAANLIGFTGTDLNGLAGIEARFDQVLAGRDGKFTFEVGQGALRKPIPGGYQVVTPAKPGSSLALTIDRDVQFMVQRILADKMRSQGATWAAAIVLDARSGEVIAQASYPTYNAKQPLAYKPSERGDMATSAVVDPGSIHKAIVLAGALQEGVVTPDSTIEVGPSIRKGDEPFRDHGRTFPEGTQLTLPGVMAYSSNVATIKIAEMLGPKKLYDYQRAFGLGAETGIGVPGEAAGLVQPPENWSGSSHGSIPIGHGVAVTPLQMAAAYAAIANDGVWVQPHIVKETIAPDGKHIPSGPAKNHRVISPENAAALRQIMEAVTVVDDATGTKARLDGYRISGKTGTGKEVKDGEYAPGEVASFIGMAPADQPKYVIAVFAHTPVGGGGAVAGPVFRDMMAYTLRHFRVPPTGTNPPDFVITR